MSQQPPADPADRWGGSPAVLVVDVSRRLADPSLETAVPAVVEATQAIAGLLEHARSRGVPVLYTRGGMSYYTSGGADLSRVERGGWAKHQPVRDEPVAVAEQAITIAPAVAPEDDEVVVTKSAPSGFFGSMLGPYLASLGVDTLVVTGAMTAGCVRATVVDAFSRDLWVVLPRECLADRRREAHEFHLTEMDGKYADVVPVEAAAGYLDAVAGPP